MMRLLSAPGRRAQPGRGRARSAAWGVPGLVNIEVGRRSGVVGPEDVEHASVREHARALIPVEGSVLGVARHDRVVAPDPPVAREGEHRGMSPLARVTIGLVDLELAGEVAASELQDRARDGDGHREARDLDRFGIRPRGPVVLRSGENTNGSSGGRHDRPASSDQVRSTRWPASGGYATNWNAYSFPLRR